jgi:hypothetical protein
VTEHPPPPPLWGLSAWTQRLKNNRTKRRFSGLLARLKGESLPETKTGLYNQGVIVRARGISIYSGILWMLGTSLYWEPVPKSVRAIKEQFPLAQNR